MKYETNEEVAKKVKDPSPEMLESIRKDLPIDFYAVRARRKSKDGNDSVLIFPLSDLEAYRNAFVKKHESHFGDAFLLENLSKINYPADYFCPQLFWDKILKLL